MQIAYEGVLSAYRNAPSADGREALAWYDQMQAAFFEPSRKNVSFLTSSAVHLEDWHCVIGLFNKHGSSFKKALGGGYFSQHPIDRAMVAYAKLGQLDEAKQLYRTILSVRFCVFLICDVACHDLAFVSQASFIFFMNFYF